MVEAKFSHKYWETCRTKQTCKITGPTKGRAEISIVWSLMLSNINQTTSKKCSLDWINFCESDSEATSNSNNDVGGDPCTVIMETLAMGANHNGDDTAELVEANHLNVTIIIIMIWLIVSWQWKPGCPVHHYLLTPIMVTATCHSIQCYKWNLSNFK